LGGKINNMAFLERFIESDEDRMNFSSAVFGFGALGVLAIIDGDIRSMIWEVGRDEIGKTRVGQRMQDLFGRRTDPRMAEITRTDCEW
jgi:hypothetical protein